MKVIREDPEGINDPAEYAQSQEKMFSYKAWDFYGHFWTSPGTNLMPTIPMEKTGQS